MNRLSGIRTNDIVIKAFKDGKRLRAKRKDGHLKLRRETIMMLPQEEQTRLRVILCKMLKIRGDSVR